MIDIINREVLSAASAGLVATGFFIWYGIGQIGAGYIGGRFNPRNLIFIGLFCSAVANLAMGFARTGAFMLVTWCVNGLIQSVLWPPVLRIIVEYFPESERNKVCTNISTTYPIAVMFAYVCCAGIVTILSYRVVFFLFALFLFISSWLWAVSYGKMIQSAKDANAGLLPGADDVKPSIPIQNLSGKKHLKFFGKASAPGIAIILFCLALVSQGILRDGLMTWIPVYISTVFSFPAGTAILFAGIIPLVNLGGIYLCRFIFIRIKDEAKTAVYFFGASFFAALFLRFAGEYHICISLFALAVIIASMMGVNIMLVTFVPAHFARFALVSFMTGLTNSMVYVGSSISNFGIALVVEKAGWDLLLTLLILMTMASVALCHFAAPRWAVFTGSLK
ncbi:MAG: MFS transporter, partial [Treponema sp.]|nr:MFS transporter [Treponema sp.]